MAKPVLVLMAAGMGSRYGGLKQLQPMDEQGHLLIDFSVYDALKAGFEDVVFIIKPEMQLDFEENVKTVLKAARNQYSKRVKDGEDPQTVLDELAENSLAELKSLSGK